MTVISVDDSVLFHAELWDLHKLAGNSLVAHPRKLTRLFRMQTACYSGMVSAITSSCSKDWSIYFVLSKQQRTDCGTCSLPEGTGPHVRQFIRAKFKFFVDRLKMSTKLVCFSQSRYALTQQYKKNIRLYAPFMILPGGVADFVPRGFYHLNYGCMPKWFRILHLKNQVQTCRD